MAFHYRVMGTEHLSISAISAGSMVTLLKIVGLMRDVKCVVGITIMIYVSPKRSCVQTVNFPMLLISGKTV